MQLLKITHPSIVAYSKRHAMLAFFCVTFRVCFSFLSFCLFIPAVGVPLGAENLKLHIDDLRTFIRIARVHLSECYYTVVVCMCTFSPQPPITPPGAIVSVYSDETLSHRIYLRMIPYYGGPAMGACLRLPRIPAHVTQQARCNPSCMLLARAFTGGGWLARWLAGMSIVHARRPASMQAPELRAACGRSAHAALSTAHGSPVMCAALRFAAERSRP